MSKKRQVSIIFPHNLFEDSPLPLKDTEIYLVEEHLYFKQYAFHKQKIAFHHASMKAYADYLKNNGIQVEYINAANPISDIRKLIKDLSAHGTELIHYIDPVDDWLEQRIEASAAGQGLHTKKYLSPMFLLKDIRESPFFRKDKKKFFQTKFYIEQRKKMGLLLNPDGSPQGGKWSFDAENRKRYPKKKLPPAIHYPEADKFFEEAKKYVEKHFRANPGQLSSNKLYPTDFKESRVWLDNFFQKRFAEFGPYEDAIVRNESILNHSLLSPLMNVGLITPAEVIEQAVAFAENNKIPLNSLEGFIRQVIGWREFIRGVYVAAGRKERSRNFWGFSRKIPPSFYEGTTGIAPVDNTIQKVLLSGYAHHIERLMVLGNFMILCEFDPDEVYRWFMELFIDAYDWVMVPNVYGMSQFADGGLMSTKPYISGSNYIRKMSDYPAGEWQVTWDGLFWRFLDKHRGVFLKNPRLRMLVRAFDKMDTEKKEKYLRNADIFLQKQEQEQQ